MTPLPNPSPAREVIAALESAAAQLAALSRGDDEAFLEGLPAHFELCMSLEEVRLGPGDKAALEELIAVNGMIMRTLNETQDALRDQMAASRSNARVTAAYLR